MGGGGKEGGETEEGETEGGETERGERTGERGGEWVGEDVGVTKTSEFEREGCLGISSSLRGEEG